MTTETKQYPFKKSSIAQVLNKSVSPDSHDRKVETKRQIDELFNQTAEYQRITDELKTLEVQKGASTEIRNKLSPLNTHIEELSNKNVTADRVQEIAECHKVKVPASKQSKSTEYVKVTLEKERKKIEAEQTTLEEKTNRRNELNKQLSKARSDFLAAEKAKYNAWKDGQLESLSKGSNQFEHLKKALCNVSKDDKESFRLRIENKEYDKDCIRLSKSGEVVSWLLKEARSIYFTRTYQAFHNRKAREVASLNRLSSEEYVHSEDCEALDMVNMDLSGTAFEMLVNTERLRDIKDNYVSMEESTSVRELCELGDNSPFYDAVFKYQQDNYKNCTQEVVSLISGLLHDLCVRLGKAIRCVLLTHGNINTVKYEFFDNILEPVFIFRGDDYEVIRNKIRAIWGVKE